MGILDKTEYMVTCRHCGSSESVAVPDRGSRWSGPRWEQGPEAVLFSVEWTDGGLSEPQIRVANCKKCNLIASVSCR